MTPMYYRGAHVALVVFSVDNHESFQAIDQWIDSFKENADPNIIIFIAGNKADLEESRSISQEQGAEKAKSYNAIYVEVSAKSGMGIDDLFNDIANTYLEKNHKSTSTTTQPKVNIEVKSIKKSSCC